MMVIPTLIQRQYEAEQEMRETEHKDNNENPAMSKGNWAVCVTQVNEQ